MSQYGDSLLAKLLADLCMFVLSGTENFMHFTLSVVHTTDAYDLLKENLMTRDDAVIGEAAGLAMGLVMIGTKNPTAIDDMINVSALLSVQCVDLVSASLLPIIKYMFSGVNYYSS